MAPSPGYSLADCQAATGHWPRVFRPTLPPRGAQKANCKQQTQQQKQLLARSALCCWPIGFMSLLLLAAPWHVCVCVNSSLNFPFYASLANRAKQKRREGREVVWRESLFPNTLWKILFIKYTFFSDIGIEKKVITFPTFLICNMWNTIKKIET